MSGEKWIKKLVDPKIEFRRIQSSKYVALLMTSDNHTNRTIFEDIVCNFRRKNYMTTREKPMSYMENERGTY